MRVCVFTGNSDFPEVRRMYLQKSESSVGNVNLRAETNILISLHNNAFLFFIIVSTTSGKMFL